MNARTIHSMIGAGVAAGSDASKQLAIAAGPAERDVVEADKAVFLNFMPSTR